LLFGIARVSLDQGSVTPDCRLVLAKGRSICLGPDWIESDATLAFDASSGDYWVLDGLGRFVVERLLLRGAMWSGELQAEVANAPAIAHAVEDVEAGFVSLIESGLIQTGTQASD
jgi:hypothetical protein